MFEKAIRKVCTSKLQQEKWQNLSNLNILGSSVIDRKFVKILKLLEFGKIKLLRNPVIRSPTFGSIEEKLLDGCSKRQNFMCSFIHKNYFFTIK